MAYTPITTLQPNLTAQDDKLKELLGFLESDILNKMAMEGYKKKLEAEQLQKNYGDLLTNDPKSLFPNLTDEDVNFVKGKNLPPAVVEQILQARSKQRGEEQVKMFQQQQRNAIIDNLVAQYPKYRKLIEARRSDPDSKISEILNEIEKLEYRSTAPKSARGGGGSTEKSGGYFPSKGAGIAYKQEGNKMVGVNVYTDENGKTFYSDTGEEVDYSAKYWMNPDDMTSDMKNKALGGTSDTDDDIYIPEPVASDFSGLKTRGSGRNREVIYKFGNQTLVKHADGIYAQTKGGKFVEVVNKGGKWIAKGIKGSNVIPQHMIDTLQRMYNNSGTTATPSEKTTKTPQIIVPDKYKKYKN